MPTCLATNVVNPRLALPSVEPSMDLQQGWAHGIAAPSNRRRPVADSLAGVPKAALRTIFGAALAQKVWQSSRPKPTEQPRKVQSIAPGGHFADVPDREIQLQMIAYLAYQAAQSLQQESRLARAVRLEFTFASGARTTSRALFAHAAAGAHEIRVGAQGLLSLRRSSFDPLVAINLTVEAVAQELPKQPPSAHAVQRESSQLVS